MTVSRETEKILCDPWVLGATGVAPNDANIHSIEFKMFDGIFHNFLVNCIDSGHADVAGGFAYGPRGEGTSVGSWNLNIQGTGCHHNNGSPKDADVLSKKFVKELLDAGHTIEHASFTSGSKEDALPIEKQNFANHGYKPGPVEHLENQKKLTS